MENPGFSNHNSGLVAMHLLIPAMRHGRRVNLKYTALFSFEASPGDFLIVPKGQPFIAAGQPMVSTMGRFGRGAASGGRSRNGTMGIFRHSPLGGSIKPVVALAVTLVALAGFASGAQAQGVVRSVHQDWQIRCDTPPRAQREHCAPLQ